MWCAQIRGRKERESDGDWVFFLVLIGDFFLKQKFVFLPQVFPKSQMVPEFKF